MQNDGIFEIFNKYKLNNCFMADVTSVIIKDDKLIFYIDDVISFIIFFLRYNVFFRQFIKLAKLVVFVLHMHIIPQLLLHIQYQYPAIKCRMACCLKMQVHCYFRFTFSLLIT